LWLDPWPRGEAEGVEVARRLDTLRLQNPDTQHRTHSQLMELIRVNTRYEEKEKYCENESQFV